MTEVDPYDNQNSPADIPLLLGDGFLRRPRSEHGRRRERRYLAVLLIFAGVVSGVLALVKLHNGLVSGFVWGLFASGLLRFSWRLWDLTDRLEARSTWQDGDLGLLTMTEHEKKAWQWFDRHPCCGLILPDGRFGRPRDNTHQLDHVKEGDNSLAISLDDSQLILTFVGNVSMTADELRLTINDFDVLEFRHADYGDDSYNDGEVTFESRKMFSSSDHHR